MIALKDCPQLERDINGDSERNNQGTKKSYGLKLYLDQISHRLLTHDEEIALSRQIRAGDLQAKDYMIRHNLLLVVTIAREYHKRNTDIMGLIQAGNIGLHRAVEKYDPDSHNGTKFSTYAVNWIRRAILLELNERYVVRIPGSMLEEVGKLRKEADAKGVSFIEICKAKRIEGEKLETRLNAFKLRRGMSLTPKDKEGKQLIQLKAKEEKKLGDYPISSEDTKQFVDKLKPEEKEVLYLRYGLGGEAPKTLVESGRLSGRTKERVRQIEKKALYHLENLINRETRLAAV